MKTLVTLPQIGANEDTAYLIEWLVEPGEKVQAGQALCIVETTKSVVNVEAERSGWVYPLVDEGIEVAVGTPIAVIADEVTTLDAIRSWLASQQASTTSEGKEPAQRRWTKKAELVAKRHGVSIESLLDRFHGEKLTAADVERLLAEEKSLPEDVLDLVDDVFPHHRIERVLILGGGDGAVQVLDAIAHTPHQRAVAILDDNEALWGKRMMGVPILGGMDWVQKLWDEGQFDAAIISISSNLAVRERLFVEWSQRGIPFTNIIAPHVMIHANVHMGQGNLIMSHARLGAGTQVGDNNFLSAFVNLEHHNRLGSHCTFGPMVSTSGRVRIGDRVSFGAGVFIEPHIRIGDDVMIASGSIIRTDIPSRVIVKTHIQQSIRPR